MEIIRKGEIPEEKQATFVCGHCDTEMRAKKKEGDYISDQRYGDCVKFACPIYNKYIYVAVSKFK